ncbi:MAG: GGDEF domain-containing protein, partial [Gammaproteobacteria bacterium]
VDLSKYDYLTVEASYPGTGQRQLRLTIIDFEHGLSVDQDWRTHKMVELDAFDVPASGRIALPMSLFQTATWWKDIAKLPVLRTDKRVDNAINVLVQTAPYNTLGEQDIVLRAVRFHGKLISQAELLGILVAMWIVCAIAWQAFTMIMYKGELNNSKAEIQLLADLNRALKLETQELAGQAQTDPLTGVLNRQGLRSLLLHSSSLLTPPLSIVFLDIDHFKKVNDQNGHQVGDQVLQQFAATVASAVRGSDKLVRWGGEEFLLLCPTTDALQASGLAEKLRARIEAASWPNDLHVTASFGVAQHIAGEDIGQVIERADAQLYAAKAAGRNRVHTCALPGA